MAKLDIAKALEGWEFPLILEVPPLDLDEIWEDGILEDDAH